MNQARTHVRHRFRAVLAVLTAWAFAAGLSPAPAAGAADDFLAVLRTKVSEAEKGNRSAIAGRDGWLFFVPELRSLAVGPFWGEHAKQVSRSSKPE